MLFEAKCVKLLKSKVFLLSKVFFEAKCASAKLEQLEFKLEKNIGIYKHAGKVRKGQKINYVKKLYLIPQNWNPLKQIILRKSLIGLYKTR